MEQAATTHDEKVLSKATKATAAEHARASSEIERVPSIASTSSSTRSQRLIPSAPPPPHQRGSGLSRYSTRNSVASGAAIEHGDLTTLSRVATARLQHSDTVGRTRSARAPSCHTSHETPLPPFGLGKPYPPPLPERDAYVVEFDGPDDPLHPQNWPLSRKLLASAILGWTSLSATFTSSVFSAATPLVAQEFHVSRELALLNISIFVLGFAFGPSFWAPLSELKGRKLPCVISSFGLAIFCLAGARAKDIETLIISRFCAGLFGAAPLAVVAATLGDMFDNNTRGMSITLFSVAVFTGPLAAPLVGGYIVENPALGWRFILLLCFAMAFVAFILCLLFQHESYPPVVLVQKAAELRRRTLNWGIHAKQEEIEIDLKELAQKNFTRPIRLLFGEPIVLLVSIYMSFIYGILYLFLTAYPIVFQGVYHWGPGKAGIAFLGIVAGQFIAAAFVLAQQPWFRRKLMANNGVIVPEWRLPSVMVGGISFSIGIFWFGWGGYKSSTPWIVPVLSGLFTGFGLLSIMLQSINYIVDAYLMFAASAIAGNTLLRSLFGAAFPLFALQLFDGLGIQWASTLLGCVSLVLAPIPFVFYKWGHVLRAKSKFAPTVSVHQPDSVSGDHASEKISAADAANLASAPRRTRSNGVLNPAA